MVLAALLGFSQILAALLDTINICTEILYLVVGLIITIKHQPVSISALYPKRKTQIEIKNFITKISYTHLHFTV